MDLGFCAVSEAVKESNNKNKNNQSLNFLDFVLLAGFGLGSGC